MHKHINIELPSDIRFSEGGRRCCKAGFLAQAISFKSHFFLFEFDENSKNFQRNG